MSPQSHKVHSRLGGWEREGERERGGGRKGQGRGTNQKVIGVLIADTSRLVTVGCQCLRLNVLHLEGFCMVITVSVV